MCTKEKCQQCIYQPTHPTTVDVVAWGLTIKNLLDTPNTHSSSPCNILNIADNIHRYEANKSQLEGQLYYITQIY